MAQKTLDYAVKRMCDTFYDGKKVTIKAGRQDDLDAWLEELASLAVDESLALSVLDNMKGFRVD